MSLRTVTAGVSSVIGVEKIKGWKVVHKSLPRIIEYGRSEGILQATASMPGIVLAAHDAAHHQASKDNRNGDKVHLPTNDLTSLCMGQPRVNIKEGRKLVTLFVNFVVGISQFFTITFMFVGWFWSIAWGVQYREALQQRRSEAVATAAIEALTKDSILHRRDVKTLVKQHKDRGKEEKGKAEAAAKAANKSQTKLATENGTTTTTNNSKLTPIDIFNRQRVKIYGWLETRRMDKFLLIKDAYGSVQALAPDQMKDLIKSLKEQSAVCIEGTVLDRGKDRNNKIVTGQIEKKKAKAAPLGLLVVGVNLERIRLLMLRDSCALPVYNSSTELTRLTHRYLDLRSEKMQQALRFRAQIISKMRRFLEDECSFVDIQVAICYRDEPTKPNRQPEFTQLDLELSFTNQEKIICLIEQILINSWPKELEQYKPTVPFPRMDYSEALSKFGTDKPDTRIPWEITDCLLEDNLIKAKMFVAKGAQKYLTKGRMI
uniref:Aminoacyl-tRNA synthetase class II (D/K/N) domain-containing protein n=1 Tax=Meloidogyne javanica TaxID=6303 RepID=A0A915LVB4_MELJA